MDDDDLPPDTIIIEPLGPFLGIVETHHAPDSISVRLELVDTVCPELDNICPRDICDDPDTE